MALPSLISSQQIAMLKIDLLVKAIDSSDINEVIRAILNLFFYYYYYQKISNTQKAKTHTSEDSIFYAHKKHQRGRKLLVWYFVLFVVFVCVKFSCKKNK